MAVLDDETRQQVARHLGMKEREIVAVASVQVGADPGAVVETHDGQRVLIAPDGVVSAWDGPLPTNTVTAAGDEPELAGDEVPVGSAAVVLEWVGDNPQRAAAALEAERAGQGRTTLISNLEKLAGQA